MTVERCFRCGIVTDTDEDHKCPHGVWCCCSEQDMGGRPDCGRCEDDVYGPGVHAKHAAHVAEVYALRARLAALEAFVAEVRRSFTENGDTYGGWDDVYAFAADVRESLAKLPERP
jgi:hypothetical protein